MFNFISNIDWGKNVLMLILYISIVVLGVIFYLFPIIQSHKAQTIDFKKAQNLNQTISGNANFLKNNLESLLAKSTHDDIRNVLDVAELKEHIALFIDRLRLEDRGIEYLANKLHKRTLIIHGETKDTRQIVRLIDNLANLHSSMRVGFPLNITKNGATLSVDFVIEIYHSDYAFAGRPVTPHTHDGEPTAESSAESGESRGESANESAAKKDAANAGAHAH